MKYNHDNKRPNRVSEPVQVYLDANDRERLDRLTGQLHTTKSDVLRRGLEALERHVMDPEQHPALRVIGIGGGHPHRTPLDYNVSVEHDRFLSETETASWQSKQKK